MKFIHLYKRTIYIFCFCVLAVIFGTGCTASTQKYNIGLLIVATGKYISFVSPLIDSAEKYFCPNHNVTYFIFTDGDVDERDNVIKIYQERLGWPFDTMMRFAMYNKHKSLLHDMDYVFACDADMLFVGTVGDEILGDRVATLHPGYVGKRGTYETRQNSTACVDFKEGAYYFAGGFYGGKMQEFLMMIATLSENIQTDLSHGVIAVWHDESHLNRFFIDHEPTIILSPSYCYPESWHLDYPKRLLALDKNHSTLRM